MRRATWAAPLIVLAGVLAALVLDPAGIASVLRGALFDAYQRIAPAAQEPNDAAPPLRVLEIDPAALARHGPWPWGPTDLARLTDEIKQEGARLVVFTFPFALNEPSPRSVLDQIPDGPAFDSARAEIASLPPPENRLAEALEGVPAVTGVRLGIAGPQPVPKAHFQYRGARPPFGRAPFFASAAAPPPAIEAASAGVAALNPMPDADGAVRRLPLLFRLGNEIVPGTDAEALRVLSQQSTITVRGDDNEIGAMLGFSPGIAALLGDHEIPTALDGRVWLAFAPSPTPEVNASALDDGGAQGLDGAVVFVGAPGSQAGTPFGPRPLASVEAQGLQDLLTGEVLRRPGNALAAESLWLVFFSILGIFIARRIGPVWTIPFTVAVILAGGFVSWRLFLADHLLIDAAGPGAGFALVVTTGALARKGEIGRTRARLRMAFAESLPMATVERIARRPSLLKLDGEVRVVSYLACGVRGFAGLAASFRDDPAAFTRLIQRVLAPLMDQVLAHDGTIDRLTADGFTAFWNAPLDDPQHALHACEAASGMSKVAARVNEVITQEQLPDGTPLAPIEIGVGIATGSVIAGGFRGHGRAGYSVNGDAILLAGRIQLLSPQYGPAVIVSEETARAAERGFAFLEVDFVAAGESDPPVKLYALLGNPVTRASPKFRALQTFHEHIFQALRERQWKTARELIDQCRKLSGASQKLYDLHLTRIAYFEANPPPDKWDGAFRPILK